MERLEVSCAVRRLYRSLGVKGLILLSFFKKRQQVKNTNKKISEMKVCHRQHG